MKDSEWKSPGMLSHFTVVRKLDGGIFPMGFTKEATDKNSKAGSNVLSTEGRWGLLAYLVLNTPFPFVTLEKLITILAVF